MNIDIPQDLDWETLIQYILWVQKVKWRPSRQESMNWQGLKVKATQSHMPGLPIKPPAHVVGTAALWIWGHFQTD
jgi:hypothetical protein